MSEVPFKTSTPFKLCPFYFYFFYQNVGLSLPRLDRETSRVGSWDRHADGGLKTHQLQNKRKRIYQIYHRHIKLRPIKFSDYFLVKICPFYHQVSTPRIHIFRIDWLTVWDVLQFPFAVLLGLWIRQELLTFRPPKLRAPWLHGLEWFVQFHRGWRRLFDIGD